MKKLSVKILAFFGAPKEILEKGVEVLRAKLQDFVLEFTDNNPDAIFIVTGGSEKQAKEIVDSKSRIIILATTESNSYAAASEIKAYCNQNNKESILYNIDTESNLQDKIENYIKCNNALKCLANYKIGLLGNVSDWLIASDIENSLLNNKFGLQIEKISWLDYPKYSEYPVNKSFLEHFDNNGFDLEDSSKVYNLIQDIVRQKQFDAITVECFPLVMENSVTACLALSKLNTEGFASGCEGDITSITGKIITKELTGQIPWMANLAALEEDKIFFAHCTIATDLVTDYKINTHFETNEGTAVQGQFKSKDATIFRLNNDLSKAFLSYGNIVERPEREDSCRTQIKINIPKNDIQKLKDNPLGNHHLVLPGNHIELLKYFCKLTRIELV